jgi:hypothetical protein
MKIYKKLFVKVNKKLERPKEKKERHWNEKTKIIYLVMLVVQVTITLKRK